jgi:hypothetical protein
MGASNRQTAQKRHADLARRHPRPPSVDTPPPTLPAARPEGAVHDGAAGATPDPAPAVSREAEPAVEVPQDRKGRRPAPAAPGAGRRQVTPRITSKIIIESRYQIVKAPDHAETRTWHILVDGRKAGMVRPTWRGERSRPGWEGVDNSGLALPVTHIGRTTAGGNARTRDAAAVSLLQALLRQQHEHAGTAG